MSVYQQIGLLLLAASSVYSLIQILQLVVKEWGDVWKLPLIVLSLGIAGALLQSYRGAPSGSGGETPIAERRVLGSTPGREDQPALGCEEILKSLAASQRSIQEMESRRQSGHVRAKNQVCESVREIRAFTNEMRRTLKEVRAIVATCNLEGGQDVTANSDFFALSSYADRMDQIPDLLNKVLQELADSTRSLSAECATTP